jgi:hypothetical protein
MEYFTKPINSKDENTKSLNVMVISINEKSLRSFSSADGEELQLWEIFLKKGFDKYKEMGVENFNFFCSGFTSSAPLHGSIYSPNMYNGFEGVFDLSPESYEILKNFMLDNINSLGVIGESNFGGMEMIPVEWLEEPDPHFVEYLHISDFKLSLIEDSVNTEQITAEYTFENFIYNLNCNLDQSWKSIYNCVKINYEHEDEPPDDGIFKSLIESIDRLGEYSEYSVSEATDDVIVSKVNVPIKYVAINDRMMHFSKRFDLPIFFGQVLDDVPNSEVLEFVTFIGKIVHDVTQIMSTPQEIDNYVDPFFIAISSYESTNEDVTLAKIYDKFTDSATISNSFTSLDTMYPPGDALSLFYAGIPIAVQTQLFVDSDPSD